MSKVRFKLLTGDVSGIPSTYYRKSHGHLYDVYEVNEWADLDSSAIATHGKYNVQAGVVSLDNSDNNVRALSYCGLEIHAQYGLWCPASGDIIATTAQPDRWNAVLVEALWQAGLKDVHADVSGNNLRAVICEARGAL